MRCSWVVASLAVMSACTAAGRLAAGDGMCLSVLYHLRRHSALKVDHACIRVCDIQQRADMLVQAWGVVLRMQKRAGAAAAVVVSGHSGEELQSQQSQNTDK